MAKVIKENQEELEFKAKESVSEPLPEVSLSELDILRVDLDTAKASNLRLQADFENFKKRNKSIAQDMYQEGVCDTITKMLPVLDSIDSAIEMAANDADKAGAELVKKMFLDILTKLGVEEIEAEAQIFDPHFHNAVMQVEDADNAGKVVKVLQKGYKTASKVIRYAMVQVAN